MILVAYRHGLRASEVCDLLGESSSRPRCTSTDIGSIVPSLIFAGAPACAASEVLMYSIMA